MIMITMMRHFTIKKAVDPKGHEARVPVVGKGVEGQVHHAWGCNRVEIFMILQNKLSYVDFLRIKQTLLFFGRIS